MGGTRIGSESPSAGYTGGVPRVLLLALALAGVSACGGGSAVAPAGVVRALSAWRAAGADYDRAIQHCAASPTPTIDFWAHCTAPARGHYASTARALDRQLGQHSRSGPCASTDAEAARDVAAETRAAHRTEAATNRRFNRAAHGHFGSRGSLASLMTRPHAVRLRDSAAVAALAHGGHHCLS